IRVDVKATETRARGLAFTDVVAALRSVFGDRPAAAPKVSIAELEALPVTAPDGGVPPARVGDVALVRLVPGTHTRLAPLAGVRAVGGIVIARRDADIGQLVEQVKRTIARESRKLPHRAADPGREDSGAAADVHVTIAYDRADLATRVRRTLLRALTEEVVV